MSYLAAFAYTVGSIVCHQIPERSFYFGANQFPVCARCTGLYAGGLLGIVFWLARRDRAMSVPRARVALAVAAVPTLVTLLTAQVGWWDPANALRSALAVPLGLVTGVVVVAGLTRNLR